MRSAQLASVVGGHTGHIPGYKHAVKDSLLPRSETLQAMEGLVHHTVRCYAGYHAAPYHRLQCIEEGVVHALREGQMQDPAVCGMMHGQDTRPVEQRKWKQPSALKISRVSFDREDRATPLHAECGNQRSFAQNSHLFEQASQSPPWPIPLQLESRLQLLAADHAPRHQQKAQRKAVGRFLLSLGGFQVGLNFTFESGCGAAGAAVAL
jgi:hypothetical protein